MLVSLALRLSLLFHGSDLDYSTRCDLPVVSERSPSDYDQGSREAAAEVNNAILDGGCSSLPGVMDNLYEQLDAMDTTSGDISDDDAWLTGWLTAARKEAKAHGCILPAYQY